MKISVLYVISVFERSLMHTGKPCGGRKTVLKFDTCALSKFTAASRGSVCDIAQLSWSNFLESHYDVA